MNSKKLFINPNFECVGFFSSLEVSSSITFDKFLSVFKADFFIRFSVVGEGGIFFSGLL